MEKEKSTLLKEIAQRLKKIRKTLDYTQLEFSGYFNCGRANYSRIETGEIGLNSLMLRKLKDHLNVDINYIIAGQGEPFLNNASKSTHLLELLPGYQCDDDDRELIEYYCKSSIVRNSLKAHFRLLLLKESETLHKDIEDLEKNR